MTETIRIAVAILDDYQEVSLEMANWSAVRDRASIEVFTETIVDQDRLVARLAPFDVVCVMRERTPLPGSVLERLPRLKLIVSTGPKNASIDQKAAEAHGIAVENTRGTLIAPMELTWALILAAARHLPAEHAALRAGGWQRHLGTELRGKTLAILGLGRIGADVAKIGQAFGMETIAWDPRLTKDKADAAGVRAVEKHAFFAQADILSVHLVLVEATRGLVGAAELAQMKRTAWLINTSRGPIVHEAALLAALRAGDICGAALDVFADEPLPVDHPFRTLDNVLATPHLGYVSRDQYEMYYADTVAHILDWIDRKPL